MVMGPNGAENEELCWRGPAAIYWTGNHGATNVAPTQEDIHTPPLVEGVAPLLNTYLSKGKQKILVIDLEET
jgi:hypothetical protein